VFPTAVSWALRLICAVLLVAVRDEEMDFTVLAECGAAFWLVMDSNDLFKALSHVLRHGAPWPGRIRIYKASLQRMMETMSISYRWQPNSVTLDEKGTNINMSTWQLQTVLDALAHSTCRYVWVDKVAVPQTDGPLQHTLLSRMMAVYAASGCTLVMRSRELEGSRYHQRGWTVQEFCGSSRTALATEPVEEPIEPVIRISTFRMAVGTPRDFEASAMEEEQYFVELRQWHLGRTGLCRPFWLQHDISVDVAYALGMFDELRGRVHTQFEADKVRALLLMLMNTPVETQEELLQMISKVESKSGRSMQTEIACLEGGQ